VKKIQVQIAVNVIRTIIHQPFLRDLRRYATIDGAQYTTRGMLFLYNSLRNVHYHYEVKP